MDKVVSKLVALGVPGLVLLGAMATTGWAGGAAIVTGLATLGGPLGMLGGLGLLAVMVLVSDAIARYGSEAIARRVVDGLKKKGRTVGEIRKSIDSYPISRSLKKQLHEYLDQFERNGKDEA